MDCISASEFAKKNVNKNLSYSNLAAEKAVLINSAVSDREKSKLSLQHMNGYFADFSNVKAISMSHSYTDRLRITAFQKLKIPSFTKIQNLQRNRKFKEIWIAGQKLSTSTSAKNIQNSIFASSFKHITHLTFDFRQCSFTVESFNRIILVLKKVRRSLLLKKISLRFPQTEISEQSLLKFAFYLRRLNSLEIIETFYLNPQLSFNFSGFFPLLRSMASLQRVSSFRFGLMCNPIVSTNVLEFLSTYTLPKLKRLTHLQLDFEDVFFNERKLWESLTGTLLKCIYLESLVLSLKKFQLSVEGTGEFMEELSKLAHLHRLSLDFSGCASITTQNLEKIGNIFGEHTQLRALELKFSHCKKLETLGNLFNHLDMAKDLKSLKLNFSHCRHLELSGIQKFTQGNNSHLWGNLQSLRLDFSKSSFNDNDLQGLTLVLTYMKNLKEFGLLLNECPKIQGPGIKSLADKICYLTVMKQFELGLRKCSIQDEAEVTALSKSLVHLSELQQLTLDFGETAYQIHRADMLDEMAKSLPTLQKVRTLRLDFESSKCVDIAKENGTFSIFVKCIRGLSSLKQLSLTLKTTQLSEKDVMRVIKTISSLPSLEVLTLNLRGVKKLTECSLQFLLKGLKKLCMLRVLNLDFSENEITSSGAMAFIQAMSVLTKKMSACNLMLMNSKSMSFQERIVLRNLVQQLNLNVWLTVRL